MAVVAGSGKQVVGLRRGSRLKLRPLLAASVISLLACACAPREGVLVPVEVGEPVAGGAQVDMLVATTRAPSAAPGVVFSGERGDGLAFTNMVVSIPPNRPVGSIQWPQQVPPNPTREFAVTEVDPLTRAGVRNWYLSQPKAKRRVLVFVHGFNTRFDAAVFRFAQFVHDTDTNLVPVLFSWPSRGQVTSYVYDRESTNFSRTDLANVLATAAASPHVDEVVVLAHSMGAWLAVEALRDLALRDGKVPAKISNVILASPDLDIDVFERQLRDMGPKRPHMTIFVSRNDRALSVSRLLAGEVTRVGAVDLTDPAYAARLEQGDGVVVLDLTALQGGDSLNHSKFATSPQMVQIMGEQFVAGQDIASTAPAGAPDVVSGLVGAVASAPIQVFAAGRAAVTGP
ncbi:alpha/beta hydrolase [Xanthobacter sp. ZOL 2024]